MQKNKLNLNQNNLKCQDDLKQSNINHSQLITNKNKVNNLQINQIQTLQKMKNQNHNIQQKKSVKNNIKKQSQTILNSSIDEQLLLQDLEENSKFQYHNNNIKSTPNLDTISIINNIQKTSIQNNMLLNLENQLKKQSNLFCQQHKNRNLEIICINCCKILCAYCVLFTNKEQQVVKKVSTNDKNKHTKQKQSHKMHKIIKIQEFMKDIKQNIRQSQQLTDQKLKSWKNKGYLNKIESYKKQIQRNVQQNMEKSKQEIQNYTNELIKKLRQQQKIALQKIQQLYSQYQKQQLKQVQKIKQTIESKYKLQNNSQIIEKVEQINKQIQKIIRKDNKLRRQRSNSHNIENINNLLKIFYGNQENTLKQLIEEYKNLNNEIKQTFKLQQIVIFSKENIAQINCDQKVHQNLQNIITISNKLINNRFSESRIKSNLFCTPKKQSMNKNQTQQQQYVDNSFITGFGFQSCLSNHGENIQILEDKQLLSQSFLESINRTTIPTSKNSKKYIQQVGSILQVDKNKGVKSRNQKLTQVKTGKFDDNQNFTNKKQSKIENQIKDNSNQYKGKKQNMLIKNKSSGDLFKCPTNTNIKLSQKVNFKSPQKLIGSTSPQKSPRLNLKMSGNLQQMSKKLNPTLKKAQTHKNINQMKSLETSQLSQILLQDSFISQPGNIFQTSSRIMSKNEYFLQQQKQKQIDKIIQQFINPSSQHQQSLLSTSIHPITSSQITKKVTKKTQILDLSKLSLNDEQIQQILQTIYKQYKKKIKYLKLSYNQLTDNGFSKIIQYLSSINNMNLSNNLLTSNILDIIIKNKDKFAPLRIVNLGGNIIKNNDKKVMVKIQALKKMGININL